MRSKNSQVKLAAVADIAEGDGSDVPGSPITARAKQYEQVFESAGSCDDKDLLRDLGAWAGHGTSRIDSYCDWKYRSGWLTAPGVHRIRTRASCSTNSTLRNDRSSRSVESV